MARLATRALSWRRPAAALACTLVAVLVTVWASAAVAIEITFDDVISVDNPPQTILDTQD
jgi:hypothetical protein